MHDENNVEIPLHHLGFLMMTVRERLPSSNRDIRQFAMSRISQVLIQCASEGADPSDGLERARRHIFDAYARSYSKEQISEKVDDLFSFLDNPDEVL